jgi:hypothetical protein
VLRPAIIHRRLRFNLHRHFFPAKSKKNIQLSYIVGYVFIYDQGYLEYEEAKGITTTQVNKQGDVLVTSSGKMMTRSFSVEELT